MKPTRPYFAGAALFALALVLLPLSAAPVSAAAARFEPGYYSCPAGDDPGNFIFVHDGAGVFATEEYLAYFNWSVSGDVLKMAFLKGHLEDKTLRAEMTGPDSFRFEQYEYERMKNVNLDKYKLMGDSRTGSLLTISSEKSDSPGGKLYAYVNVRDNKNDKYCEMELVCKKGEEEFICRDEYRARRQGGKIALKNFGQPDVELQSTISGSHNYEKPCDYNGKFRRVKAR